ncbi:MAG TPA: hypothetical protein VIJ12_02040 [Candidatus Baltobacteraceae bacterium]
MNFFTKASCAAVAGMLLCVVPAFAAQTIVVRNNTGTPVELSVTKATGSYLFPGVTLPSTGHYQRSDVNEAVQLHVRSAKCGSLKVDLARGRDWTVDIDLDGASCKINVRSKDPKGP